MNRRGVIDPMLWFFLVVIVLSFCLFILVMIPSNAVDRFAMPHGFNEVFISKRVANNFFSFDPVLQRRTGFNLSSTNPFSSKYTIDSVEPLVALKLSIEDEDHFFPRKSDYRYLEDFSTVSSRVFSFSRYFEAAEGFKRADFIFIFDESFSEAYG